MSLSEAILGVADEMDEEAKELTAKDTAGEFVGPILKRYARQLRTAVKASGGNATQVSASLLSSEVQHRQAIDRAREEIRKDRAKAGLPVIGEQVARVAVGGPHDGDFVSTPDNLAAGDKSVIAGAVYSLGADGKVHFNAEETAKLKGVER